MPGELRGRAGCRVVMHPDHGIQAAAFNPCQQGRLQRPCVACRDATVELRPGAIFPCGDLDDAAAIAEGIVEFPAETREVDSFQPRQRTRAMSATLRKSKFATILRAPNIPAPPWPKCCRKSLPVIPRAGSSQHLIYTRHFETAPLNSRAPAKTGRPPVAPLQPVSFAGRRDLTRGGEGVAALAGQRSGGRNSQRVGSGNRDGSGNLFSLRSQEAK